MLKVFRQKGVAKKVLWVVSGIIIISFGFGFGMSRLSDKNSDLAPAGKLFGKTVSLKEFRRYNADVHNQMLLSHGAEIERLLPYMDINNETWTRIMLVKEADRRKIKVDDREVIALIANQPVFQKNGSLDKNLYNKIVGQIFRRDPRSFEEGLRDGLKIMKLLRPATPSAAITQEEARKEYGRRNRKIQVSYALIDPTELARNITPTEEELKAYYQQNREDFLVPDSINVQYVAFKLADKTSQSQKENLREQANTFFEQASSTPDFAAAAKNAGLEARETGFFNMEQLGPVSEWPLEFVSQLFSAKEGLLLAPVSTPEGFLVARPLSHAKAYIPDFTQAQSIARTKFIERKALELAEDQARSLHSGIKNTISGGLAFSEAARQAGLNVKKTSFFALGDYVPEIGLSEDFTTASFLLTSENKLSDVVLTSKGPVIIAFEAEQPADEKKFSEVQEDFLKTLEKERTSEAITTVIRDLRNRAGLESYLSKEKPDIR